MTNEFITVTEIAGDDVSREQIDRLCNRYYWAGGYCIGKDAIEVACGSGQGVGYLASVSKTFVSGDFSGGLLAIARKYYGDRIAFLRFDAQALPFKDESKDVIVLFEAIYYIPNARQFISECRRVLRQGGQVLIATANKDLYDFNPSPYSFQYYSVIELANLFREYDFDTDFWGDTPVNSVSFRQKILRPVKKTAVSLGLMPKTAAGKKWLKNIVFGGLTKMPSEIGAPSEEVHNQSSVYYGKYVQPKPISSSEPDKIHKVIYCCATKNLEACNA